MHYFLAISTLMISAMAQAPGRELPEVHPSLTWSRCSAVGECEQVDGEVTMDQNWRWIHQKDGFRNCYDGNQWAGECFSGDSETCTEMCAIEGADYKRSYGVNATGDSLTLGYVTRFDFARNVGSRLYLLASTAKYEMFTLLNNEIAFDVELSSLGCGLNGALYFVMMDEDGGMGRYPTNTAGAEYGTGYCDSKCSQGLRFVGGKANNEGWIPSETDDTGGKGYYGACCSEMNVWDANAESFALSAHPCMDNVYHICDVESCGGAFSEGPLSPDCDPIGCDFNPYRMGVKDFYGPAKTVDTTKKFTVVTQFTEHEVTRYFIQDGKRIDMPESAIDGVSGNSLNDEFCEKKAYVFDERDRFNELGGWTKFQEAMGGKWVLVMSIRDDHYSHMLWLDSSYPPERAGDVGTERGDCEGDSGDPNEIEATLGHATVTFSNIRFGPVGSTVDI